MSRIIKTIIVLVIILAISILWSYIVDHMPLWMLHMSFAVCIGSLARMVYVALKEKEDE